MDIRLKALAVVLPIIAAAYVGFTMLQPAMDEAKAKETSVAEKETENNGYTSKLASSNKISARQLELKQQIEQLRGSVPKDADSDLLLIDLEKMCRDAGMNMISFNAPKDNGQSRSVEDATKKKQDKLKNMMKTGTLEPSSNGGPSTGDSGGGELEHYSKSFTVSGDFQGLQKLVHELETYQRVVKIDDLSFHLPTKASTKGTIKIEDNAPADGEEGGDSRLMFITMTITSYYLP